MEDIKKLGDIMRVMAKRLSPAEKLEAIREVLDAKAPRKRKAKPESDEQPELPEAGTE